MKVDISIRGHVKKERVVEVEEKIEKIVNDYFSEESVRFTHQHFYNKPSSVDKDK